MKRIVAFILAYALCLSAMTIAEEATLTVKGMGVVNLDADLATITLGAREISADVTTAQGAVNERISAVVQKLQDMGVNGKDIHTSSISIYPEYNYDVSESPVVGYSAETTLSVTISDIEHVGRFIDAAFKAGANTFSDIRFSASDTAAENSKALELAIQNAFEKASVMAAAAGMKLGPLQAVSEADYGYSDSGALYAKAEAAADTAATEVYSSPLRVSASVTARFTMEPAD